LGGRKGQEGKGRRMRKEKGREKEGAGGEENW